MVTKSILPGGFNFKEEDIIILSSDVHQESKKGNFKEFPQIELIDIYEEIKVLGPYPKTFLK